MVYTKQGTDLQSGKLTVDAKFGIVTRSIRDYDYMKDERQFYETALKSLPFVSPNQLVNALGGYNSFNVPASQLMSDDGKVNPNASLRYHDDWAKEMQRAGLKHDYTVGLQDKGKAGSYYLSAGYLNEQGYLRNTDFERFSTAFNGNVKLTRWLKAGLNGNFATHNDHYVSEGYDYLNPIAAIRMMAPISPVYMYDAAGNRITDPATGKPKYDFGLASDPENSMGDRSWGGYNPVYTLLNDERSQKNTNLILQPYLLATITKGLTLYSDFNYNSDHSSGIYHVRRTDQAYNHTISKRNENNYALNERLDWDQNVDRHHIKLSAGYDRQHFTTDYNSSTIRMPYNQTLDTNRSLKYTASGLNATGSYEYQQKYSLFAGVRLDQLHDEYASIKNTNTFWAAGLGYDMSQENFMKNAGWIDRFKLTATHGLQGSLGMQAEIEYPYYYGIDINHDNVYNYRQTTAGLDMSFFGKKLDINVNIYSRKRLNGYYSTLAFPYPSPQPLLLVDGLQIRNSGAVLALRAQVIGNGPLRWQMQLNAAHNDNTIVNMADNRSGIYPGFMKLEKGSSLNDLYMPEYAGTDPNTGEALYYIQSNNTKTNDYGSLTADDYTKISTAPVVFGAFTNTLTWKRFDLQIQLSYGLGGKFYDNTYQSLMGSGLVTSDNWHTDILGAWTQENRNSDIPRLNVNDRYSNSYSNRFVKGASYLNIKTVYLAYNFATTGLAKARFKSLSLYLTADNLWLFSARKGMDPQAVFNGFVGNVYAPARTIMFGIHAGI
ncbi:MAG: hypothetical protein EOP49_16475 [Sphingobacteriales bacterium]|nr:MAG: hypothetical protein EOP49_16475 [Sphingobacteriales bacterium]